MMKLNEETKLLDRFSSINCTYLFSAPFLTSYYCGPLVNSENELNFAVDNGQKMLQLRYDQRKSNAAVAAFTNALSMNRNTNTSITLATTSANSLRLNNGIDTLANGSNNINQKQINGLANTNIVNSNDGKKLMLKKTNNDRKYPCGYPGCHWVFTRTNHVVRHQKRVHPGYVPQNPVTTRSRNATFSNNANQVNLKSKDLNTKKIESSLNTSLDLSINGVNKSLDEKNKLSSLNNGSIEKKVSNKKLNHLNNSLLNPSLPYSSNLTSLKNSVINCHNSNLSSNFNESNNLINSNLSRQQSNLRVNSNSSISQPLFRNQSHFKLGNIRRFQCNVDNCGQKFNSELLFNNHLKLVHRVDRSLINKSVNLSCNSYLNNNLINHSQNNSNPYLNNGIKNLTNGNNIKSNMINNYVLNNVVSNPKIVKNNINDNHFKLFLSNKTVNNDQDSFTSYLNNFNTNLKLKILQSKANNSVPIPNNLQQQLVTKIPSPSMTIQPKMFLPVSALNSFSDQQNKQILITQIEMPSNDFKNEKMYYQEKLQPQYKRMMQQQNQSFLFLCEIKNCLKSFDMKENLIDHLIDEHRIFEPEIIVNLENSENWLLLEDPKKKMDDLNMGQTLLKSKGNDCKQDCRPSRISRSFNEPSLASTLGIVKDVVTKIDNVNTLNNIAATSTTTYSGITKTHACNINNCTKSFYKRYHLVRHRLEAHQVGRLSLMEDILAEKGQQNDLSKETQDKNNSNQAGGVTSTGGPFYMRRPPQDYRPYPCKYPKCGWSFKRQYHLKRHIKTHQHYFENCPEKIPKGFKIEKLSETLDNSKEKKLDTEPKEEPIIKNDQKEIKSEEVVVLDEQEVSDPKVQKSESLKEILETNNKKINEIQNVKEPSEINNVVEIIPEKPLDCKNQDTDCETNLKKKQKTKAEEKNICETYNFSSIQCEFSDCGKVFNRKRQYDLHIKNHLSSNKNFNFDYKKESQNLTLTKNSDSSLNSSNEKTSFSADEEEDSSSEERFSIIETSRSSRSKKNQSDFNNNLSLDIDNKLIENQQLVLLCNSKDRIFFNPNENKIKNKEKNQFVCDVNNCGKKFGRNCELTRHKLNHMDFWPYICAYSSCGKKFKRKDVYKNHQRTHEKNGDKLIELDV